MDPKTEAACALLFLSANGVKITKGLRRRIRRAAQVATSRPYCCGKPMQPTRPCDNCGCTLAPRHGGRIDEVTGEVERTPREERAHERRMERWARRAEARGFMPECD